MGSRSGIRRPHYGKSHQFADEEIVNHYGHEYMNLAQPYIIDGGKIESAMTRKASGYESRNSLHTDHNQRNTGNETGNKNGKNTGKRY